ITRVRERLASAGAGTVILCDTSGSMAERAGAKRKIDHLREALRSVFRPGITIIEFNSVPRVVESPNDISEPSGGTDMASGIRLAAAETPERTIIISDGEPNNESDALEAAKHLSGTIDVIYCGPDNNTAAISFMR